MYYIKEYEHIGILYGEYLDSVMDMICEHYNNEMYHGCFFFVNQLQGEDFINSVKNIGYTKIIYYNLEHIGLRDTNVNADLTNWWSPNGYGWEYFKYVDESWDFLLENKDYYGEYSYKYRFMPMRYVDMKRVDTINPKYDLLFYGVLDTPTRQALMSILTVPINYGWLVDECDRASVMFSIGFPTNEMYDVMSMSKFVLDYPHYSVEHNTQNCVRIFELLCKNKNVVSCLNTNRRMNYFGDLVKVLHIDNEMYLNYYDLCNYVKNASAFDVAERYKALTYNDEDYEKYKKYLKDTYNNLCK